MPKATSDSKSKNASGKTQPRSITAFFGSTKAAPAQPPSAPLEGAIGTAIAPQSRVEIQDDNGNDRDGDGAFIADHDSIGSGREKDDTKTSETVKPAVPVHPFFSERPKNKAETSPVGVVSIQSESPAESNSSHADADESTGMEVEAVTPEGKAHEKTDNAKTGSGTVSSIEEQKSPPVLTASPEVIEIVEGVDVERVRSASDEVEVLPVPVAGTGTRRRPMRQAVINTIEKEKAKAALADESSSHTKDNDDFDDEFTSRRKPKKAKRSDIKSPEDRDENSSKSSNQASSDSSSDAIIIVDTKDATDAKGVKGVKGVKSCHKGKAASTSASGEGSKSEKKAGIKPSMFLTKEEKVRQKEFEEEQARLLKQIEMEKKIRESFRKNIEIKGAEGKQAAAAGAHVNPFFTKRVMAEKPADTASDASTLHAADRTADLSSAYTMEMMFPSVQSIGLPEGEASLQRRALDTAMIQKYVPTKPATQLKMYNYNPKAAKKREEEGGYTTKCRSYLRDYCIFSPDKLLGQMDWKVSWCRYFMHLSPLYKCESEIPISSTDSGEVQLIADTATVAAASATPSLCDAFKPTSAAEICGNRDSARAMLRWMEIWAGKRRLKKKKKKGTKKRGRAREDYDEYAEEAALLGDELTNVLILRGPSGAGKSAAVHACAEQCGFKVIEVGANGDRKGSEVRKLVGEAVQSHSVGVGGSNDFAAAGMPKRIDDDFQENAGKLQSTSTARSMNLIFFDEADVVFDEDTNFYSAIQQLAKVSKCPIVLTTEMHLTCMKSLVPLEIEFTYPTVQEVSDMLMSACGKRDVSNDSAPIEAAMTHLATAVQCDVRSAWMMLHLVLPNLHRGCLSVGSVEVPNRSTASTSDTCQFTAMTFQEYLMKEYVDVAVFDHMRVSATVFADRALEHIASSLCVSNTTEDGPEISTAVNSASAEADIATTHELVAPHVSSVHPRRGLTEGAFTVNMYGENFLQRRYASASNGLDVEFCHVSVHIGSLTVHDALVVSDSHIAFTIPPMEREGVYTISITLHDDRESREVCISSAICGEAGSWIKLEERNLGKITAYLGKKANAPVVEKNALGTLTFVKKDKRGGGSVLKKPRSSFSTAPSNDDLMDSSDDVSDFEESPEHSKKRIPKKLGQSAGRAKRGRLVLEAKSNVKTDKAGKLVGVSNPTCRHKRRIICDDSDDDAASADVAGTSSNAQESKDANMTMMAPACDVESSLEVSTIDLLDSQGTYRAADEHDHRGDADAGCDNDSEVPTVILGSEPSTQSLTQSTTQTTQSEVADSLAQENHDAAPGSTSCDDCNDGDDVTHADDDNDDTEAARSTLDGLLIEAMKSCTEKVMEHKLSKPFMFPVDPEFAPGYAEMITEPMDLGTIAGSLEEDLYMKSEDSLDGADLLNAGRHSTIASAVDLGAFVRDMRLIWSNCRTYNNPKAKLSTSADTLSNYFEALFYQELEGTAKAISKEHPSVDMAAINGTVRINGAVVFEAVCSGDSIPVNSVEMPEVDRNALMKSYDDAQVLRLGGREKWLADSERRSDPFSWRYALDECGMEYCDDIRPYIPMHAARSSRHTSGSLFALEDMAAWLDNFSATEALSQAASALPVDSESVERAENARTIARNCDDLWALCVRSGSVAGSEAPEGNEYTSSKDLRIHGSAEMLSEYRESMKQFCSVEEEMMLEWMNPKRAAKGVSEVMKTSDAKETDKQTPASSIGGTDDGAAVDPLQSLGDAELARRVGSRRTSDVAEETAMCEEHDSDEWDEGEVGGRRSSRGSTRGSSGAHKHSLSALAQYEASDDDDDESVSDSDDDDLMYTEEIGTNESKCATRLQKADSAGALTAAGPHDLEGSLTRARSFRYLEFVTEKNDFQHLVVALCNNSTHFESSCRGRSALRSPPAAMVLDYIPMLARMVRSEDWQNPGFGCNGPARYGRSRRASRNRTRFRYTSERTMLDEDTLLKVMSFGSIGRRRRQNLVPRLV